MNNDFSLLKQSSGPKSLIRCGSLSVLLHLSLFVALIGVAAVSPDAPMIPRQHVINVDLVSMASDAAASPKQAAANSPKASDAVPEARKPEAEPVEKAEKKKTEVVKKAPEKKKSSEKKASVSRSKTSLKHRTYKPDAVKNDRMADMKAEVERQQKKEMADALSRIRDRVEKEDRERKAGTGIGGESGRTAGLPSDNIKEIYLHDVGYHLEKNWAFSASLAGTQESDSLMAFVVIKIMPSGEISDYWFEKRSGNSYFDESAARAVMKANPLPPFPEGVTEPFITMGYNFNPRKR